MLDAGTLAHRMRAGAGVNTIDVDAASRRGIYVELAGKNAVVVAELTFALMLALRSPSGRQRHRPEERQVEQEGASKARGLFGARSG